MRTIFFILTMGMTAFAQPIPGGGGGPVDTNYYPTISSYVPLPPDAFQLTAPDFEENPGLITIHVLNSRTTPSYRGVFDLSLYYTTNLAATNWMLIGMRSNPSSNESFMIQNTGALIRHGHVTTYVSGFSEANPAACFRAYQTAPLPPSDTSFILILGNYPTQSNPLPVRLTDTKSVNLKSSFSLGLAFGFLVCGFGWILRAMKTGGANF